MLVGRTWVMPIPRDRKATEVTMGQTRIDIQGNALHHQRATRLFGIPGLSGGATGTADERALHPGHFRRSAQPERFPPGVRRLGSGGQHRPPHRRAAGVVRPRAARLYRRPCRAAAPSLPWATGAPSTTTPLARTARQFDPAYAGRLDRLIRAADADGHGRHRQLSLRRRRARACAMGARCATPSRPPRAFSRTAATPTSSSRSPTSTTSAALRHHPIVQTVEGIVTPDRPGPPSRAGCRSATAAPAA